MARQRMRTVNSSQILHPRKNKKKKRHTETKGGVMRDKERQTKQQSGLHTAPTGPHVTITEFTLGKKSMYEL